MESQGKEILSLLKQMSTHIDQRFEAMDQRFDAMDQRFDRMDERFDRMDERFDRMDERFDRMDERFDRMDIRQDRFDQRQDDFAVALTKTNFLIEHSIEPKINALFDGFKLHEDKLNELISITTNHTIQLNTLQIKEIANNSELIKLAETLKKQVS